MERLQKFMARAGVTSRRRAEEMIREGRVKVNDEIIQEMGCKVDPDTDVVMVDNRPISLNKEKVYILLNKPSKVVTTLHDPQKRVKVTDFLKDVTTRVYPVGRLDYLTEGLLLLTNDGELAFRLTHPKFKVPKTYLAKVKNHITEEALNRLRKGVMLEDGKTMPAFVKKRKLAQGFTLLELTIREGRNRQVRRMCEAVGYPVVALKRISFGPLSLGDMESGQYRFLTEKEIKSLKKACQFH